MSTDLTSFAPRLLLQWEEQAPDATHRAIDGTLVFADVSGFTRLSERLARAGGKSGAEEMTDIINGLFGELLTVAAGRGGEMLKYGGDAVLLFFRGDGHAPRAAAAAHEMQRRLGEIGRVETARGAVRLRMSVGMHSGTFDLFKVGGSHTELIVAGPATTETVRMEGAANAGEVLLSTATARQLPDRCLAGERDGGRLLRRAPEADVVPIVPSQPSELASRFVSVGVREHLAAGLVDPDHRLATVAFLHVMGVDGLLDEVGPAPVATWLHETLVAIQDAFADFGVTFLATDLAGDGTKVMAAAGVPRADADADRLMLLALRRVVEAQTPLAVRTGVNRGHVFAAAVGPPYRQTFTTIGDVTNTAARVMGQAKAGEVLALRAVLDHARGRFQTSELAPFVAKGKAEPLVPYRVERELTSTVDDATRFPLTGRDDELAALVEAAEAARRVEGALVEIVGDMGAGKTRLIDELLGAADDLDSITVHCEPYHRSTPFHPIRRLLEHVLFADEPDDPVHALRSRVDAHAPELDTWLPLIGDVLDLDIRETDETRFLEPEFRLQRTAATIADLLAAVVRDPTVFIIEDTHWLDDVSASALRRIEAGVDASPWLVCVTRRDEPSPFAPGRAESRSIRLGPLAPDAVVTLVDAATSDAPMPPHRRDAIVERAAGNPLFLTELLDAAADTDALPNSLEAVMAAQIDRLTAQDRRLLRHAAVLGSRFDVALLAEVAGEPASLSAKAVAARLQLLCIPDGPRRLRFRHQLIRDVAYEALPYRQRRDLHARAGEAIERSPHPEEQAGILSLHSFHARDHERCWRYARMAAKRAGEKYANVEAVELLERALAAAKHLSDIPAVDLSATWDELSVRYEYLGNLPRAKDALRQGRREARHLPKQLALMCRSEARIAQREANSARLLRWLRRGLAVLDGLDEPEFRGARAELQIQSAWAKHHLGRQRDAIRWAELALAEGDRSGDERVMAYAYMVLDGAEIALGRPSDPERARRALAIFERHNDVSHAAVVANTLGAYAYYQGRWTEAVQYYERGRDAHARVGDVTSAATGTFNIAEILVDQGRIDDAERLLDEVATLWRSVTYELGLASIALHRGRVSVQRGSAEDALALFDEARTAFQRYDLAGYAIEVDARSADCLLRLGRIEDATHAVTQSIARAEASGEIRSLPLLRRVLGYCAFGAGDLEAAWQAMDESLHVARSIGAAYDVALTLEGFSILAEFGGRSLEDGSDAERRTLLTELGVIATVPPPIVLTRQRARLRPPPAVAVPAVG